jgi:folate-dependent phosphoribosylglycinamide formyltransferase PurN
MKKPLVDFKPGKLRVAGLISGSGKSLLSIVHRQKELESTGGCNFEVGVFSDNPNSQAKQIGMDHGLPVCIRDIHAFYEARGKHIRDTGIREEFDRETADFLKELQPHVVIYAGYVWRTTDPILKEFLCINCHPADLSVARNGHRLYAGANGVRDALVAGETRLHSTLHLVTAQIDHGPILLISGPVPVEEDPGLDLGTRSVKYLRLLNEKSRRLCAQGIEKIAAGAFVRDSEGNLYYEGQPIPEGYRLPE